MKSENEIRHKARDFLETVINPPGDIDDYEYREKHLCLNALLWVLEEFDHISPETKTTKK